MTKSEDFGSPGWSAAYFMQTIEDVTKDVAVVATAAALRSPRPSAVFSIKDDNCQFQNFQRQFTRLLNGSSPSAFEVKKAAYNPEVLTSLKRQWARFQLHAMNSSSEARKGKVVGELKVSPMTFLFFPLSGRILPLLCSHSFASAGFNVLSINGFHHNVKNNHMDEFHLQGHLSFLDEGPKDPDLFLPSSNFATDTDAMFFNSPPPNWGVNNEQHRCSHFVTDIGSDPFGWKTCHYYASGYCKNGTSCRFLHDYTDSTAFGGEFDVMERLIASFLDPSPETLSHQ
ncbi:hypothetical protein IFM89_021123 [Coptis chinensis]|uniref:C3H1-type domain-containing protein n=1 Tax=Coptis chinensis TaxID=261450 RepID=A0A835GXH1_9MAGN|nr:hypothetical protein IFM89_021123 [Coptis chinensis]